MGSTGNGTEAIDDNPGTRWISAATDPQSLIVDMGAVVTVTAVTIDWEAANAKDYVLRGSADGIVWTDIETLTDMATGERTDVIDDIDADYRYLKMDGQVPNTTYGYSIWEFNVCGEETEVPVEPFECYALDITGATASTGNAVEAIDNNPGTRWGSEASDPQWITVDLGVVSTVHGVSITWETANAKEYVLRGSVDGTVWVDIESFTNMPTGERVDEIGDIEGEYRYIRMDGVVRNTPYGYSIWEFVVCGEEPEMEYIPVPAVIQAEDWYAMNGVQTEPAADTGGGLSVGYIDAGDWMDYPIDVATAGTFIIDARVASTAATGVIEYFSDATSLGTVAVPNTGG
ncbi:MAG: carbohydrate-binding protein, partial [Cytophagaceae bacterium]